MNVINNQEANETASEYNAPRWSVLSFDKCEISGLSYKEAQKFIEKMAAEANSGLCIVTDKAASKVQVSKARSETKSETSSDLADSAKHFSEML